MNFPQIRVLGLILSYRARPGSNPGPANPRQLSLANPGTQHYLGIKDNRRGSLHSLLEMCLAAGLPHRPGGADFIVLSHQEMDLSWFSTAAGMLLWAVPGGSGQGKASSSIANGEVGSKLSLEGIFPLAASSPPVPEGLE